MRVAKIGLCLAGVALAAATLSSCGASDPGPTHRALVRIPAVKSGYQLVYLGASSETTQVDGVKLALAEYEQQHPDGPKVTIRFEDTDGDGGQAVPLAYAAIEQPSVLGIIGPGYSGESAAVNPLFDRAGIPEVSPSATNATLTESGWKTFHRLVADDAAQGAAGARIIKKAGTSRPFLIDDAEAYGTGLVGHVSDALGSSVVGRATVHVGDREFGTTVSKVLAAGADAVYYGGYFDEAGPLVKQLHAAGWHGLFVSGDGVEKDEFVRLAGAAANGAVLTNASGPASADFAQRYRALNGGAESGANSTQSYDAANILLQGILGGATSRAALQQYVDTYQGEGESGRIKFTSDGSVSASAIWAYHVADGKLDTSKATLVE